MLSRERLLYAALLIGVTATPVGGQTWAYFDNHCRIGSMRTCGNVRVNTLWDPVALVTRVEMWVRNLQGTHWNDNTLGSPITKIGLTAPKITGAANLAMRTEGPVETVGSPSSVWAITNKLVEGPITFSSTSTSAPQGGILGCDNIPSMPATYYRTCDRQGSTGWVVFSFTTTNQWSASAAQIAWQVHTTTADGKWYWACRSEADPANTYDSRCAAVDPNAPVTATPEPVTMALLGSGLLGVAGAAARRRRREQEEADSRS